MTEIKGYVEHIIYRSPDSGYTVLSLNTGEEEVTCVGILPFLSEGETIAAEGSYTVHASYGPQFRVSGYQVCEPEGDLAVERYLGSGAVRGIGMRLAARIVRRFGQDTFRIIEEEPERLAEIKGISLRMARDFAEQLQEKKDAREAMVFLGKFGISMALATKIYDRYGSGIYHVIQDNPYQMADDIAGVGFRICDDIARKAGIQADSDFRVRCALFYALGQASLEGHIFLPAPILISRTEDLLEIRLQDPQRHLQEMAVEGRIVLRRRDQELLVYAAPLYSMEKACAQMLVQLNIREKIPEETVRRQILMLGKRNGTDLDDLQVQAIWHAASCGVLVVTGGPGTGKTTTINTMISYFRRQGKDVVLAAPTGRAARRMKEATGWEAKTIHRLLEVEGVGEHSPGTFGRNRDYPLEADVIIVDEMSMVDIYLFYALLQAIPVGTRLVMVGDASQLPSVGPGCVLKDLIASGVVRVVRLTRIFRQALQSDIVVNAHRINDGEHFALDNRSRDFFFLSRAQADQIIGVILLLVAKKLPGYVKAAPEEIQVLTPTRKGLLGVERLNSVMQGYLNPKDRRKREFVSGERIFREGDKVMQIRNDYQITWEQRAVSGAVLESGSGIFNGDMGTIREIDEQLEMMEIEFDDRRFVQYPFSGLEDLEHAYAVTIHKSQGSEYPAVVIPVFPGPRMLMNRNLIYTAVTRAKSCVVLVGQSDVFWQMVDNTSVQKRYSTLEKMLREAAGQEIFA